MSMRPSPAKAPPKVRVEPGENLFIFTDVDEDVTIESRKSASGLASE